MRRNINALGLDLDALRQFEWNDSNWSVDLSYGFRADGIESFDYLKAIDGYFSTCEMQNIDCENIDCENIDCAYIDSDKIESMEIMVWLDENARENNLLYTKIKGGVIDASAISVWNIQPSGGDEYILMTGNMNVTGWLSAKEFKESSGGGNPLFINALCGQQERRAA